ncbi:hypothetical protein KAR91_04845 [Candidatus Pacearchaeota archaeon]|nr:hypothetical protein [Candidatus Pacearchaeota archaeon]
MKDKIIEIHEAYLGTGRRDTLEKIADEILALLKKEDWHQASCNIAGCVTCSVGAPIRCEGCGATPTYCNCKDHPEWMKGRSRYDPQKNRNI